MISEKGVCVGLAAGAFLALAAASVSAQGWIDYVDKVDRFGVSLPGQPAIQEITYTSWRLHTLPARVYTVEDGPRAIQSRWSISGSLGDISGRGQYDRNSRETHDVLHSRSPSR